MSEFVLDASAVIAVLRNEPGADTVWPLLQGSLISAVNLAEVLCASQRRGIPPERDAETIRKMQVKIVPFDGGQAQMLADILLLTIGSSVGFADRACLALAKSQNMIALTGDHDWLKHDVGVEVRLFRKRSLT
ncbi:MAG: type II toxin-antitoxin system VapC family toxin [Fuerstiella sp.]